MATILDHRGPIEAATVYKANKLMARDVTMTLPQINFKTIEMRATGPVEVPIPTQIENMELSLTKQGIGKELGDLLSPERSDIEIRWVQPKLTTDGTFVHESCKAFLNVMSKGAPGLAVNPGEVSENECLFTVFSYRLVVDGKEMWNVNKLNGTVSFDGTKFSSEIESLL